MVAVFRKTVIFVAVVALLVIASGCSLFPGEQQDAGKERESSSDAGFVLPDAPNDADPPPALPPSEDDDSLPPLPEGNGVSEGPPIFG